jgi:quercetin dioxygenase-like cupin family protein
MKCRLPVRVLILAGLLGYVLAVSSFVCAQPNEVEITAEPHHHLVLENKFIRVFRVEVPPGETTLLHRHNHDYVYVTLGASDLDNRVQGKPAAHVQLQDGETRFLPGNFAHAVRDLATTPSGTLPSNFCRTRSSATRLRLGMLPKMKIAACKS